MNKENKTKNKKIKFIFWPMHGQRGTVIVYVAIVFLVLVGFAALAVDIGHLAVARNELQDAADAGALAGAGRLYSADGTAVNDGSLGIPSANQFAYNAAIANTSQNQAVEIQWTGGNTGDIQRGHWSFATRQFIPSDRTTPPQLWDYSTQELDDVTTFSPPLVNAVRVVTRRESTPVVMTFARILGFSTYPMKAQAVAYLGFAGTLGPGEVDQPIAICRQAILNFDDPTNPEFTCGVGRMINSGSNTGHQTGGWTNFSQNPCQTASTPTVRPLINCSGSSNPAPILLGAEMGTTGGEVQTVFDDLTRCWQTQAGLPANINSNDPNDFPTSPWRLRLPVINCDGNNVGPCSDPVGAVEVDVLWITRTGFKNPIAPMPARMENVPNYPNWTYNTALTPQENWNSFATNFHLYDVLNNTLAFPEDKTIYFLPDCTPHELGGRTGGPNFGILAKIPVLVAPPPIW